MKEFDNLQTCFSATREELFHQRTKVNESKIKVQTFTQKMRRLTVDEKPLIKEISHYQRQVIQNEINQKQLEMDFKQNETNIEHYKTIITKLIRDSKEDERIFSQENSLLKRYQDRTEKAKENLKILNKKNKYSENNYHDLKELSRQTENENRQLKQQYAELTFIVQLLGQRQVILSNQLKPLYEKSKCLTKRHFDQGTYFIIERMPSFITFLSSEIDRTIKIRS
jgi:chromosome segregation ATPase